MQRTTKFLLAFLCAALLYTAEYTVNSAQAEIRKCSGLAAVVIKNRQKIKGSIAKLRGHQKALDSWRKGWNRDRQAFFKVRDRFESQFAILINQFARTLGTTADTSLEGSLGVMCAAGGGWNWTCSVDHELVFLFPYTNNFTFYIADWLTKPEALEMFEDPTSPWYGYLKNGQTFNTYLDGLFGKVPAASSVVTEKERNEIFLRRKKVVMMLEKTRASARAWYLKLGMAAKREGARMSKTWKKFQKRYEEHNKLSGDLYGQNLGIQWEFTDWSMNLTHVNPANPTPDSMVKQLEALEEELKKCQTNP